MSDLLPNEIGRFLLSQRQIIIHTEKLHNERARLNAEELKRLANAIAADQREFKNSFNDYIHLEGAGAHDEGMATGDCFVGEHRGTGARGRGRTDGAALSRHP